MIICEYCKKDNCFGACEKYAIKIVASGIAKSVVDGVKQDVHYQLFGSKDVTPNKIFSWWNPLHRRKEVDGNRNP